VGAGLFSQLTSDRTRGNTSSCTRGGLDWILGKISLKRAVKHWSRLPSEAVESPSLDGFRRHVAVVLRDTI